jgi:hypothetical protein
MGVFIDIHVHVSDHQLSPRLARQRHTTPEELIGMFDRLGIERGVMMPVVSPEHCARLDTTEEIIAIAQRYPSRLIPFCNVDPRQLTNTADAPLQELLEYYKELGCRGVGEITANLRFDDPRVRNLFKHCQALALPVTFHIAPSLGNTYGLYDEPGLPLLEGALREFPDLTFLGHSQPFWAEIGPLENVEERRGYPRGPVTQPGRTVELMRKYPNLCGDLSSGSGYNAVSRDEEFGCAFLEEFEGRLFFGTDITSTAGAPALNEYLLRLRAEGRITEQCFQKVARRNAVRLLELVD